MELSDIVGCDNCGVLLDRNKCYDLSCGGEIADRHPRIEYCCTGCHDKFYYDYTCELNNINPITGRPL